MKVFTVIGKKHVNYSGIFDKNFADKFNQKYGYSLRIWKDFVICRTYSTGHRNHR